jgi:hypothetical protein
MAVDQSGRDETQTILSRFRCAGCGYGASCTAAPERCPMCGVREWEPEAWPSFAGLAAETWADLPLEREAVTWG